MTFKAYIDDIEESRKTPTTSSGRRRGGISGDLPASRRRRSPTGCRKNSIFRLGHARAIYASAGAHRQGLSRLFQYRPCSVPPSGAQLVLKMEVVGVEHSDPGPRPS